MLLRIDVLEFSPSGAAALGDVVAALRQGRDLAPTLTRARDLLAGPPRSDTAMSTWSGVW